MKPCFVISRLRGKGESLILEWHLDLPKSQISIDLVEVTRFRLKGWVLANSEKQVHLAIRQSGVTRCYPLNANRADVVQKVLNENPVGHPRLMCGFDIAFPLAPQLDIGIEIDATFVWLIRMKLEGESC